MDERSLIDFIQRIIDSASNDEQAQTMLRQLHQMLMDTARCHPEDAALQKLLNGALGSIQELRQLSNQSDRLSARDLAIAKQRADERRAREASYRGRC